MTACICSIHKKADFENIVKVPLLNHNGGAGGTTFMFYFKTFLCIDGLLSFF